MKKIVKFIFGKRVRIRQESRTEIQNETVSNPEQLKSARLATTSHLLSHVDEVGRKIRNKQWNINPKIILN